jgi:hypothetical protein
MCKTPPDCIRKIWENLGKLGKKRKNPENSGKFAEKIGQNRTK